MDAGEKTFRETQTEALITENEANGFILSCQYKEPQEGNKDKYYLVYILINTLGGVCYFPCAFVGTAIYYWMFKFQDPIDNGERNYFQKNFTATCGTMQELVGIIFPLLTYLSKLISLKIRIILVYIVDIVSITFVIAMVKVDTSTWQKEFYYMSIAANGILTIFGIVAYINIIEITSYFPPKYFGVIELSSDACGIITAVIQIFCLLASSSPFEEAYIYFGIALGCIILSIGIFVEITKRSAYYRRQMGLMLVNADIKDDIDFSMSDDTTNQEETSVSWVKIRRVIWKIKVPLIALTLNTCTTLTVHPGLTVLVVSEGQGSGSKWNDDLFTPVVVFLLYSSTGIISRLITLSLKHLQTNKIYFLLVFSMLRVCLIPLLMLCNAQPRNHLPVIFHHDYYFILIIIMFASTDAYLTATLTLLVPRLVEQEDTFLAYTVSTFVQLFGLSVCSYANIFFVNAV